MSTWIMVNVAADVIKDFHCTMRDTDVLCIMCSFISWRQNEVPYQSPTSISISANVLGGLKGIINRCSMS